MTRKWWRNSCALSGLAQCHSSKVYVESIINGKRGAAVLQAINAEENVNHMISR